MAAVVDDHVEEWLVRTSTPEERALFVAGCVERMLQVYTWLASREVGREKDIDVALAICEALWDDSLPPEVFEAAQARIDVFEELEPSDTELVGVSEIYRFYFVVAIRQAVAERVRGAGSDAVECAHLCLTAMGQLDQNIDRPRFMDRELERQRRHLAATKLGVDKGAARDADRAESLERARAIQDRLLA